MRPRNCSARVALISCVAILSVISIVFSNHTAATQSGGCYGRSFWVLSYSPFLRKGWGYGLRVGANTVT